MKTPHRAAVAGIAVCLGVALNTASFAGSAAAPAAKPSLEDRSAASSAAATVTRILDRWHPVASLLQQDVRVWRAQFGALLDQVSPATLKTIDALDATPGGPNRTLIKLYDTAYLTAVMDVGTRVANQVRDAKAAKLGSTTTDLVFVPVTPCRIVDTRNAGPGITAGNQRNFYYYSEGNTPSQWSVQGGNALPVATDCPGTALTSSGGTLGTVPPAAVMANIAAVNTTAAGNFIAWGGSVGTIPITSVLNWDHPGEIIANTTVIPWGGRTGGNLDFTVRYNGPNGSSDVVVDVMGYFVENAATALDCTTTSVSGPIPTGTGTDASVAYPSCPTGYTRTGGYCNGGGNSGTSGVFLIETGPTSCVFRTLGSASTGFAVSQCCRVPGR